MPKVKISIYVKDTRDGYCRYLGISIDKPMSCNYYEWPKRVVICGAGSAYEDIYDLSEGRHTLYLNVTDYVANQPGYYGKWDVRVTIKSETDQVLVDKVETISKPGPCASGGGGNAEIVFTVGPPQTIEHVVTIKTTSGGSVEYSYPGGSGTVPPNSSKNIVVKNNDTVTVKAVAQSGYRFDRWVVSRYHTDTSYYSNPLSVTISSTTTIRGEFVSTTPPPPEQYTLTYNIGDGGKAKINNKTYSGSGSINFTSGTVVTVEPVPNEGYQFDKATVNGSTYITYPFNITMSSNKSLSIQFKKKEDIELPIDYIKDQIMKMMNEVMLPMTMMMMMMNMMMGMMQGLAGAFG
ncbi:MAG: hypothetical protein RMI45_08690 [Ignisphaera sp.]|nr:hypothetical protein [Ignisphaera sp.]